MGFWSGLIGIISYQNATRESKLRAKSNIWHPTLLFVLSVALLCYLVYLILVVYYWSQVEIIPSDLLTEYAKFLGTLTIAVLSYLVVHEYWYRRKTQLEHYLLLQRLIHSIQEVGRLVVETSNMLHEFYQGPKTTPKDDVADILSGNLTQLKMTDEAIIKSLEALETSFLSEDSTPIFLSYKDRPHHLVDEITSKKVPPELLSHFYKDKMQRLDALGIGVNKLISNYFSQWKE